MLCPWRTQGEEAAGHKSLTSAMKGWKGVQGSVLQGLLSQARGGGLSAECVGVSVMGFFVGFLLRTMSIERYLDPDLTLVMVLSKGRSKPDSNTGLKRVKLGGRRETSTTALTRDGDDGA